MAEAEKATGTKKATRRAPTKKTTPAKKATGNAGTNGRSRRGVAMTQAHKDALASGRREGSAVRSYIVALDAHKPKKGRKITPENLRERLDKVNQQLATAKPWDRLELIQQRMDLEERIEAAENVESIDDLQNEFIAVGASFAARKGITYNAFREFGVPVEVLKAAGIAR